MRIRPWQYILFSVALIAALLAASTGTYFAVVRQERLEQLERIESESEELLKQVREAREQLDQTQERLDELEVMLVNLNRTQAIMSGTATPSRSGRRHTAVTMPVTMASGYSAARLDRALKGTGLAGLGEALAAAEEATGINALILVGICALETGWGTSRLARDKCNMGGLGAYDGREYSAGITFSTRESSVMFLAELLRDKPGGCLAEIGAWYATDPRWARKVGGCVKIIAERSEKQ